MKFSLEEKRLLKQIIQLKSKKNLVKLPTISAFMQKAYFCVYPDMFLMIQQGKAVIFFREKITLEQQKILFYRFHEMLFLLNKLQRNGFIDLIHLPNDEQTLCMASDPEIIALMPQSKIDLSQDKKRGDMCLKVKGKDSQKLYFGIVFPPEINNLICQIIPSYALISETLVDFVNNDYMFPEETYTKQNLKAAWCGIGISIVLGIVSIIIQLCCK